MGGFILRSLVIFSYVLLSACGKNDLSQPGSVTPSSTSALGEVRITGGYVAQGTPSLRGVRLLNTGSLNRVEDSNLTLIATLSQSALSNYQSLVAGAQAGTLVDRNPGQGFCADSPETNYIVYRSNVQIVVGKLKDCHTYTSDNVAAQNAFAFLQTLEKQKSLLPQN